MCLKHAHKETNNTFPHCLGTIEPVPLDSHGNDITMGSLARHGSQGLDPWLCESRCLADLIECEQTL